MNRSRRRSAAVVVLTTLAVVASVLSARASADASVSRAKPVATTTYPITIHDAGTFTASYAGEGTTYNVDFKWDESRTVTIELKRDEVPSITRGPLKLTASGTATSSGKKGFYNDNCAFAPSSAPTNLVDVEGVNDTGGTRTITVVAEKPFKTDHEGSGPLTATGTCTTGAQGDGSADGPAPYLFYHPSSLNKGYDSAWGTGARVPDLDLDQLAQKPLEFTFPVNYTETDAFGGSEQVAVTNRLTVSARSYCPVDDGSSAQLAIGQPTARLVSVTAADKNELWCLKIFYSVGESRPVFKLYDPRNTIAVLPGEVVRLHAKFFQVNAPLPYKYLDGVLGQTAQWTMPGSVNPVKANTLLSSSGSVVFPKGDEPVAEDCAGANPCAIADYEPSALRPTRATTLTPAELTSRDVPLRFYWLSRRTEMNTAIKFEGKAPGEGTPLALTVRFKLQHIGYELSATTCGLGLLAERHTEIYGNPGRIPNLQLGFNSKCVDPVTGQHALGVNGIIWKANVHAPAGASGGGSGSYELIQLIVLDNMVISHALPIAPRTFGDRDVLKLDNRLPLWGPLPAETPAPFGTSVPGPGGLTHQPVVGEWHDAPGGGLATPIGALPLLGRAFLGLFMDFLVFRPGSPPPRSGTDANPNKWVTVAEMTWQYSGSVFCTVPTGGGISARRLWKLGPFNDPPRALESKPFSGVPSWSGTFGNISGRNRSTPDVPLPEPPDESVNDCPFRLR
jgi:hypothetical protein